MRPLKRPMFRTGGPIKEGLMNGLKDGGPATYMADATMMAGGGMPNMRGRVTGPGGYAGLKDKFMGSINYARKNPIKTIGGGVSGSYGIELLMNIINNMSSLPLAKGGLADLPPMRGMVTGPGKYSQLVDEAGNILKKSVVQTVKQNPIKVLNPTKKLKAARGILSNIYDKGKRFFRVETLPKKRPITKPTIGGVRLTPQQRAAGMGQETIPFSERFGYFLRKNPFLSTYGAAQAVPIGFGAYKAAEAVVPPVLKFIADPTGFYRKRLPKFDDKEKDTSDTGTTKPGASNVPDAVSGTTKKTQAEIDAEKEALDKQKLDRIYKLLGVDRAKKDAASKALIDMSRYIDEGGRDVISKKNIGSTISKAIGAFDKRLDKVDQLKEAAGLMRAKGIIEKDIRESDNKLKELSIELKNKELNPKFADLKIVAGKTMAGQKGYDSAASAADPENFRGNIITQSEFSKIIDDIKEKSGELDETIIIKNWTEEKIKGKNLTDGNYTVGSSLVTIKDNKVVNVAR